MPSSVAYSNKRENIRSVPFWARWPDTAALRFAARVASESLEESGRALCGPAKAFLVALSSRSTPGGAAKEAASETSECPVKAGSAAIKRIVLVNPCNPPRGVRLPQAICFQCRDLGCLGARRLCVWVGSVGRNNDGRVQLLNLKSDMRPSQMPGPESLRASCDVSC